MTNVNEILKTLIQAVKLGNTSVAKECLVILLKETPAIKENWLGVARMAMLAGEINFAKEALQLFTPKSANNLPEQLQKLAMLVEVGEIDKAYVMAEALLPSFGYQPQLTHFLGTVALQLGDVKAASSYIKQTLKQWPVSGQAWLVLTATAKIESSDTIFKEIKLCEDSVKSSQSIISKSAYYAALCKAHYDTSEFEKAFEYASISNGYLNETNSFQYAQDKQNVSYIASHYQKVGFKPIEETVANSKNPIFVIGLPRSGTTLLEQILCSHSKVNDGGEFNGIERASMCLTKGQPIGSRLEHFDPKLIDKYESQIKQNYLRYIHQRFGENGAVVDKSLNNNRYLWLIKRLFPASPIIIIKRDIEDTAWSCYRTHFSAGLSWSLSLENIAKHFALEENLAKIWEREFSSSIYRLHYADLVKEPAKELSSICNHCGIDYQQNMLKFSELKRAVLTASVSQVRDELHQNALGTGQKIERLLSPFTHVYTKLVGNQ